MEYLIDHCDRRNVDHHLARMGTISVSAGHVHVSIFVCVAWVSVIMFLEQKCVTNPHDESSCFMHV